jgi:cell division protein FtsQ
MSNKPFSRSHLPRLVKGEVLVDEQMRRRINRARFRRAMGVIAVLGVIGALAFAYFSPVFRVQEVKVEGAAMVSEEEIRDAVDAGGSSMLTARFGGAEARIMENPLVSSVTIKREWPNTVKVTVAERAPWGSWRMGDKVYAIDKDGIVLPMEAPQSGPAIKDLDSRDPLAVGEQVSFPAIRLAVQLLQHVPPRLKMGVTAMEWSDIDGMAVGTDAGYQVVIGGEDDLNYKLTVWAQIDTHVGRANMSGHVLDLRHGDRPSLQ